MTDRRVSTEAKAVLAGSLAGLLVAGAVGFVIGWKMGQPRPADLGVQDLGGCRRA